MPSPTKEDVLDVPSTPPPNKLRLSLGSMFDWGDEAPPPVTDSQQEMAGTTSRYDPSGMSRIVVDINDLVDDSGDDSDDDTYGGTLPSGSGRRGSIGSMSTKNSQGRNQKKKRPSYGPPAGSLLMFRQVIFLVSLVGIIAAASVAIGYAMIGSGGPSNPLRGGGGRQDDGQKLLEIAERVITACAESNLNADMTECQKLCKGALCCFDEGEYSCADDESKACGVYGGCEALVEGIPLGAGQEDEG